MKAYRILIKSSYCESKLTLISSVVQNCIRKAEHLGYKPLSEIKTDSPIYKSNSVILHLHSNGTLYYLCDNEYMFNLPNYEYETIPWQDFLNLPEPTQYGSTNTKVKGFDLPELKVRINPKGKDALVNSVGKKAIQLGYKKNNIPNKISHSVLGMFLYKDGRVTYVSNVPGSEAVFQQSPLIEIDAYDFLDLVGMPSHNIFSASDYEAATPIMNYDDWLNAILHHWVNITNLEELNNNKNGEQKMIKITIAQKVMSEQTDEYKSHLVDIKDPVDYRGISRSQAMFDYMKDKNIDDASTLVSIETEENWKSF